MLILDIFAMRAKSGEGKLQVELAQLKYRLPRLRGFGVEMSRTGAGIGTRGPGETRLESDRRHIRRRISALEEEIKELINTGKATFYIGFDCTADSLTAGHFMALTLMKRLQMAGNRPIALIGGGTTMIGDPSGRTDMRKMLTKEDIAHNAECFKRQMERFIEFGEGKAMMLNNADWLLNLNYIELLREVGASFSVNRMLTAECYKQRMEKGLSFLEFNYMIMQSYDFYYSITAAICSLAATTSGAICSAVPS